MLYSVWVAFSCSTAAGIPRLESSSSAKSSREPRTSQVLETNRKNRGAMSSCSVQPRVNQTLRVSRYGLVESSGRETTSRKYPRQISEME